MKFPDLSHYDQVVVDTETTGLCWWLDKMFSVAITLPGMRSLYFDIRDDASYRWAKAEFPKIKLAIGHNIKFDFHMLREAGIHLDPERLDCTMIRAALIDEHRYQYDLDSLAFDYVGIKMVDIWSELAELFGGKPTRKAQIGNLYRAPPELVAKYAMGDTIATAKLWAKQEEIIEVQNLQQPMLLERRVLPVVIDMEYRGVPVDLDAAKWASDKISGKIKTQQRKLNKMAGFDVNVNPSNSLKQLIVRGQKGEQWYARDGTRLNQTEGGAAQIDAVALKKLKMPEAKLVLSIRQMRRTKETFLDGHVLGHHHNGIIHASINQTKSENDRGTKWGRFSISEPALQQIHKRNKSIAKIVRACFIPDDDGIWQCFDWAQMDFRIFAHYTNDLSILKIYQDNPHADFHQLVADITGLPRNRDENTGGGNAKQINLGLVFGMGPGTLASEMGLPYTEFVSNHKDTKGKNRIFKSPGAEAEAIFDRYHTAIPGVRSILDKIASVARSRGHVKTYMGRLIRFPRGEGTFKAGGLVFQGTAADALKVKMVEIYNYLQSMDCGARLMLTVHDEFNFSTHGNEKIINAGIKEILEDFQGSDSTIKLRVPIRTDHGYGPNWWSASK